MLGYSNVDNFEDIINIVNLNSEILLQQKQLCDMLVHVMYVNFDQCEDSVVPHGLKVMHTILVQCIDKYEASLTVNPVYLHLDSGNKIAVYEKWKSISPWTCLKFKEYLEFVDNANYKIQNERETMQSELNTKLQDASPSRIMCWFTDPKNLNIECKCGECKPRQEGPDFRKLWAELKHKQDLEVERMGKKGQQKKARKKRKI